MGGEKDLSANIKRAFLVDEMAWPLERVFKGSPSPFAILPTISFFQAFGIAARTPAVIKESTANAEFAFKISNERKWPSVSRRSLILKMPLLTRV